MAVRIYLAEEIMTAYLDGELDHHSAKQIREDIDDTALRAQPSQLILDFRDVTFMDSSGIGLVMGRYALMQELGGELQVINLATHLRKVMKLAGLDRLAVMDKRGEERMKAVNEMKLTFKSRSANEGFARTAVSAFVATLDPTVEELTDIKTAVSEAVTNCIVHGYRESIANVYITAAIYPDNRVVIKIKDKGCGIEDIEKAMEPLYTSCTSGERAGLGFAVMQSLCDRVRVSSKPGKGTTVTLVRKISSRGGEDEQH